MSRICILFLPSLLGLAWQNEIVISIVWSLVGSVFVAFVSQTPWFKQTQHGIPFTFRLLRPEFSFHLFFLGANVAGNSFYILNAAGFASWSQVAVPSVFDLRGPAVAQSFMLLAHASVTAGMKLNGFNRNTPHFHMPTVPQGVLLTVSFIFLAGGALMGAVPGLEQVRYKLVQLASIAVLVELTFAVVQREFEILAITLVVLVMNLIYEVLSGWKGLVLWTMITLGALLYPLMPRRVLLGGLSFVLVWFLFLHPFGLALRPLIWSEGIDQKTASTVAFDEALKMSFTDRLDNIWTLMVERANEMYQFEKYLRFVPDNHPYFGLELAQEALYGLVPRIFWPDKPQFEQLAMRRVYDAGIVVEKSEVTVSAKSNFYQDAYLSFGWLGIIPACVIFGFVMMSTSHAAEQLFGGYEIGTCLLYTALFGELVRTAPNFLFFVGAAWSSFLVMTALFIAGRVTGWIVPVGEERGSATRIDFILPTHS